MDCALKAFTPSCQRSFSQTQNLHQISNPVSSFHVFKHVLNLHPQRPIYYLRTTCSNERIRGSLVRVLHFAEEMVSGEVKEFPRLPTSIMLCKCQGSLCTGLSKILKWWLILRRHPFQNIQKQFRYQELTHWKRP